MSANQSSAAARPSQGEIARRAFEIWKSQGSPSGRERDHWLAAERELRATAQPKSESGLNTTKSASEDRRPDLAGFLVPTPVATESASRPARVR